MCSKRVGSSIGFHLKRRAKKALTKAFQDMSSSLKKTSSLLTMCGKTVLFLTESTGAMLVIDCHGLQMEHYGAVIVLAPKGRATDLVAWLEKAISMNWQYQLGAFSLNDAVYNV